MNKFGLTIVHIRVTLKQLKMHFKYFIAKFQDKKQSSNSHKFQCDHNLKLGKMANTL